MGDDQQASNGDYAQDLQRLVQRVRQARDLVVLLRRRRQPYRQWLRAMVADTKHLERLLARIEAQS